MFEFRERRSNKDKEGGLGFLSESPISKHKRGGAEFFLNKQKTENNNKNIKDYFQSPRLISPE